MKIKRVKAILSSFVIASMLFSNSAFAASAFNTQSSKEKAISNLINAGWTMNEINDFLNDEELLKYSDCGKIVSETHYVRIEHQAQNSNSDGENAISGDKKNIETDCAVNLTKDEFFKEVNEKKSEKAAAKATLSSYDDGSDDHTTSDGYLRYTLSASYGGNSAYSLSLRYQWYITPGTRATDVIGLGHGDALTQTTSATNVYNVFKADYAEYPGSTGTLENSGKKVIADNGGTAISFDLPANYASDAYTVTYSNFRGYMRYDAVITYPTMANQSCGIYGIYKHQALGVKFNPSIGYPSGGTLSVSPSLNYVAETPNAYFAIRMNY